MISIATIDVDGFRNLVRQRIRFAPRFNVVFGENGQGKTNLLEAIYVATTSRSFRTSTLAECTRHEVDFASVSVGVIDDRERGSPPRAQSLEIREGRRTARIDGKRPASLASFAVATPVVLFEPASLLLSQGGAAERRRLLDRVALHLASTRGGGAAILLDLDRYRRAHHHRRRALEKGADARTLGPYERLMADHGARIVRVRGEAAAALAPPAVRAFAEIARVRSPLSVTYLPRAPDEPESFARLLCDHRGADGRRGTATVGPHLDDLSLSLGGRPARQVASQGQHRAIVLALKSAELAAIADARGAPPVLLLDDVSSELDPSRNAALFEFLRAQAGQVVLTTTRPEVIELRGERADFLVREGAVEAAAGARL